MGRGAQSGGDVDRVADEVVVAAVDLADVDRGADVQRSGFDRPRRHGEGALDRRRGTHRRGGQVEHDEVAVALTAGADDLTAVVGDEGGDAPVDDIERRRHRRLVAPPGHGARLDVGEQQAEHPPRHGSNRYTAGGWCLRHTERSALGSLRYTGSLRRMPAPEPSR